MPWLWNWRNDKMYLPDGVGTEVYKTGWGACQPTEKFINKLIENDGMDSYRRKAWVKNYDEVLYEMPYASDGPEPVMGYSDFKASDPTRGIWKDDGLYGHCGWFMWKLNIRRSDLSNNNRTMMNTRIFRYTEVLFLYMECAVQTGKDKDKALQYLNDIQKRAGAKHISTELTMNEIKNEKMLECWLEGLRFLDLVRWGDTDELAMNGKDYPSFRDKLFTEGAPKHEGFVDRSDADWCIKLYPNCGFQKGKHELFPFPFSETSVNENIVQNPGW